MIILLMNKFVIFTFVLINWAKVYFIDIFFVSYKVIEIIFEKIRYKEVRAVQKLTIKNH